MNLVSAVSPSATSENNRQPYSWELFLGIPGWLVGFRYLVQHLRRTQFFLMKVAIDYIDEACPLAPSRAKVRELCGRGFGK